VPSRGRRRTAPPPPTCQGGIAATREKEAFGGGLARRFWSRPGVDTVCVCAARVPVGAAPDSPTGLPPPTSPAAMTPTFWSPAPPALPVRRVTPPARAADSAPAAQAAETYPRSHVSAASGQGATTLTAAAAAAPYAAARPAASSSSAPATAAGTGGPDRSAGAASQPALTTGRGGAAFPAVLLSPTVWPGETWMAGASAHHDDNADRRCQRVCPWRLRMAAAQGWGRRAQASTARRHKQRSRLTTPREQLPERPELICRCT